MANHTVPLQFSHFSVGPAPLKNFLQQEASLHFLLLFTLSIGRVLCRHWGEQYQRRCRTYVSVSDPWISSHITSLQLLCFAPCSTTKRYPDFRALYLCPNFKADIPQHWEQSENLLYCSKSMQFGKVRDEAGAQLGSIVCWAQLMVANSKQSCSSPWVVRLAPLIATDTLLQPTPSHGGAASCRCLCSACEAFRVAGSWHRASPGTLLHFSQSLFLLGRKPQSVCLFTWKHTRYQLELLRQIAKFNYQFQGLRQWMTGQFMQWASKDCW